MNSTGMIVAVLGIIVLIVAAANHFAHFFLTGTAHVDLYIGVVGLVVLLIGGFLAMRKAA
ncbi:MAG TPA: hypothetical protein VID73_00205 [Ktedonobacterales bacterium]|jgi:hypothetical protein